MPNHIQNRLIFDKDIKEINAFLKKEDKRIDFNNIIKRPDDLNISIHRGIEIAVEKKYNAPLPTGPFLANLEKQLRKRPTPIFEGEDKELFEKACQNYEKYGYYSWYNWSVKNWGTKWNAYYTPDDRDKDNIIYFQTAWSGVPHLICKFSEKFPETTFQYAYADEDTGSNVGKYSFRDGHHKVYELKTSDESYELAFELWPDDIQHYKKTDNGYELVEE